MMVWWVNLGGLALALAVVLWFWAWPGR